MSYKPRSLFRLMDDINDSIFLPHIQRPFVWNEDQMKLLFDSLMQNYPIQTFLFWRTKEEIKPRRFMEVLEWDVDLHDYYDEIKGTDGCEKVLVLDGQQRLQTLYVLYKGAMKSPDGKSNLEAYFDVTSGESADSGDPKYRLEFLETADGPTFYRLRDLLGRHAQKDALEIADELNDRLDEVLAGEAEDQRRQRQRRVSHNLSRVVSILREEKFFWVQELDGVASSYPYRSVLDIFVRVNSGGTKLLPGDLMFAVMKQAWSEIEQRVEGIVSLLNESKLSFDKHFVLKCLLVAHDKGAEVTPEKFKGEKGDQLLDAIKNDWDKAENAFRQMRDFITGDLRLYGDKVIRSYNSFIPVFDFLFHNPPPDEPNKRLLEAYYYKSQLFNWYGAQTDAIVDVLHQRLGKSLQTGFPKTEIWGYFTSRGKEVDLKREHLTDIRIRHIILNLVYVRTFGVSPFDVKFKGNEPHVDHIYPQSLLRSRLGLDTAEINHLGNYRFVGALDNIRKRAELPDSYFVRLIQNGIDISKHLLVQDYANDPRSLKFDQPTYVDFRDRRFEEIFKIASAVVNV
jgi:hypothetical protein